MITDNPRKSWTRPLLAGVAAVTVCILVARLSVRIDLTDERLYTLTEGSASIIAKMERPVALKLFFSESSADVPMTFKTYAARVTDLLKEYAKAGKGKIVVETFDPKPDSEQEEWARKYGIRAHHVNPLGHPVFFGIVAVSGKNEAVLPQLSPQTEDSLEYDITRLLVRVRWPDRPVVGVMSSLPDILMPPDRESLRRNERPKSWVVIDELRKDYTVVGVPTDAESIDPEVKALVLVHARGLSERTLFAIDQFLLKGGRLIACVDPACLAEFKAKQENGAAKPPKPGDDIASSLGKLFDAWGVRFDSRRIVTDLAAATRVNVGNGKSESSPAFLTFRRQNMNSGELIVSRLKNVMFPFAGEFGWSGKSGLKFTPLVTSSEGESGTSPSMNHLFGVGNGRVVTDRSSHVVAARLSGKFKTAFPSGPDWKTGSSNEPPAVIKSGEGQVVLFADADFIANDSCIQVQESKSGPVIRPVNDNLALFANAVEQLTGHEELIGLAVHGSSHRPFEVVDRLEAEAMGKWQQKKARLEIELAATQQRLLALQRMKSEDDEMSILSSEQMAEIAKFRKSQEKTRRDLKGVRRELTADIDRLGRILKAVNVAAMPLIVTLLGCVYGLLRRRMVRLARKGRR